MLWSKRSLYMTVVSRQMREMAAYRWWCLLPVRETTEAAWAARQTAMEARQTAMEARQTAMEIRQTEMTARQIIISVRQAIMVQVWTRMGMHRPMARTNLITVTAEQRIRMIGRTMPEMNRKAIRKIWMAAGMMQEVSSLMNRSKIQTERRRKYRIRITKRMQAMLRMTWLRWTTGKSVRTISSENWSTLRMP